MTAYGYGSYEEGTAGEVQEYSTGYGTTRKETAKEKYDRMDRKKSAMMETLYRCADYTIPSMFMRGGMSRNSIVEPYSQIGAEILRNGASRDVLTTLPANVTFIKLIADPIYALRARQNENFEIALQEALAIFERKILNEIDTLGIRQVAYETFLYWRMLGDVLFYMDDDGTCRNYRIDEYCVDRDRAGNLLDIVIKESIALDALPKRIREHCIRIMRQQRQTPPAPDDEVDLYTCIHRLRDTDNNARTAKFEVYQECLDEEINEDDKPRRTYDIADLPYLHLRYQHVSGSPYGMGLIEPLLGALISAEGQKQIMVEGGAALAKIVFGANTAIVDIKDLRRAPNGGYVPMKGLPKDAVGAIQANKNADLMAALQLYQEDQKSLYREGGVFDVEMKERTPTANLADYLRQDHEMGRAGPQAMLQQEFTRPLGRLIISRLQRKKVYPKIGEEVISLRIVTGLEALGRGQELDRATRFLGLWTQTAPVVMQSGVFDFRDYTGGLMTMCGVDGKTLGLMSRQRISAEQAARMQLAAQAQEHQVATETAGRVIEDQFANQAQPQAA